MIFYSGPALTENTHRTQEFLVPLQITKISSWVPEDRVLRWYITVNPGLKRFYFSVFSKSGPINFEAISTVWKEVPS
jgi:hypothetical protein